MKLFMMLMLAVPLIGHAVKPNILLILADDLGYGDLSVQGCKQFETPNIDRIFNNGVRFRQGYVSNSVCAPSRAGILTGRMGSRFGFEANLDHKLAGRPRSKVGLPVEQKTMADVLKTAGYGTLCIGKWHLGDNQELFHPLNRGFDDFFGLISGSRSYGPLEEFDPVKTLMNNHEYVDERTVENFYMTDVLTDKAIKYIRERHAGQPDKPFFMYLSYTAPHGPMEAKDEVLARLGEFKNEKRKIYAGMVVSMDDNVGRMLACLDEVGITENTLIVFLSDNGGPTEHNSSYNGPLKGTKGTLFEGGVRVPFAIQWKGVIEPGQVSDARISSLDLLPTFAFVSGADKRTKIKTDGINLMPLLAGRTDTIPDRTFYWRRGGKTQTAIREGEFKYHMNRRTNEEFLWNIEQDIGEKNNLINQYPEVASRLRAKYEIWEKTLPPLGAGIGAAAERKSRE